MQCATIKYCLILKVDIIDYSQKFSMALNLFRINLDSNLIYLKFSLIIPTLIAIKFSLSSICYFERIIMCLCIPSNFSHFLKHTLLIRKSIFCHSIKKSTILAHSLIENRKLLHKTTHKKVYVMYYTEHLANSLDRK